MAQLNQSSEVSNNGFKVFLSQSVAIYVKLIRIILDKDAFAIVRKLKIKFIGQNLIMLNEHVSNLVYNVIVQINEN